MLHPGGVFARLLCAIALACMAGPSLGAAAEDGQDIRSLAVELTTSYMAQLPEPPEDNDALLSRYLETYQTFLAALREERAALLAADATVDPAALARLQTAFTLTESGTRLVMRAVNALKQRFLGLALRPAAGDAAAPAEWLRSRVREATDPQAPEVQDSFIAYLAQQRPADSSTTYLELAAAAETEARVALANLLSSADQEAWKASAPDSLLDIDTGYDPLSAYVAGGGAASN